MDATIESEGTPAKKPKPMCKYRDKWDSEFTFFKECKVCNKLVKQLTKRVKEKLCEMKRKTVKEKQYEMKRMCGIKIKCKCKDINVKLTENMQISL